MVCWYGLKLCFGWVTLTGLHGHHFWHSHHCPMFKTSCSQSSWLSSICDKWHTSNIVFVLHVFMSDQPGKSRPKAHYLCMAQFVLQMGEGWLLSWCGLRQADVSERVFFFFLSVCLLQFISIAAAAASCLQTIHVLHNQINFSILNVGTPIIMKR